MLQNSPIEAYLEDNYYLCLQDPKIQEISNRIVATCQTDYQKVEALYTYVRDQFPHSFDIHAKEVSMTALDVLENGHGICYAKSNLLAALLRIQQIPTGFCYQRLILDDNDASKGHCLHALNAVYLQGRWYCIDARGNKPGVNAQFSLSKEQLAFTIRPQYDEIMYETIYATANLYTLEALKNSANTEMLMSNLPTRL